MRKKEQDKKKFLKYLQETGNVVSSCFKARVPKSTIYRWRLEDQQFLLDFEKAQDEGRFVMSSIAEGVVIKNIKGENQRAAEFYLRHNDPHYARKPVLTPEETLPLSDRRSLLILNILDKMRNMESDLKITEEVRKELIHKFVKDFFNEGEDY
jgi:hypothetical protein